MNLSILSAEEVDCLLDLEKNSYRPAAIVYYEKLIESKRKKFITRCTKIGYIDLSMLDDMIQTRKKLDDLLSIWVRYHLIYFQQTDTKRP